MSALADLLESRHDNLVERWTRAVEAELARAAGKSRGELRDHIPQYLRTLVGILRNGSTSAKWASGNNAREHGRQRFRLGFDCETLVREYGLLRGCIFDLIEESVCPATLGELRILTDYIAGGVAEAVHEHGHQQKEAERAAARLQRERQAWSTTTLQSIGDAVIATDPTGSITFLNASAEQLTGWSEAEALGRPLPEIFRILQETTRAELESPVVRALRQGHVVGLGNHTILRRKDGSERPIDDSAAPIRNEQGELTGVVLVFRDVTERRQAAAAIGDLLMREKSARAEAELERQRLHSVFMQTAVAICIVEGPQHTFTFANPAYRALVGGRELVGKPLLEALPELRGQGFDTLLDRVVATGEPVFGGEVPAKLGHHGQGESLVMNFFYNPKRNVDGQIDGVLVTVTDVTEQVRARNDSQALADRLRHSEERLRRVVDASGTGTWELDVASDDVSADAQHLLLLGLLPDASLTLRGWLAAAHSEDRPLVARAFDAAARGADGGRFSIEHRTGGADGVPLRWIELRGQLLGESDGQPARVVGTSVEVTDRKRTERALADERDKLQTIFRESPAAMALWSGPELVFEMLNPEYQAIFGARALAGKPLLDAVPELVGQEFAAQLLRVLQTGEPLVGKEVLARLAPRQGGPLEDHFYDFTYVRINDSNGKPYGVYDHAMDVTERVQARRALEASQERLQLALSGARMGSWTIVWPAGTLMCDERFRQMHNLGGSASAGAAPIIETIDQIIDGHVHPDDRGRIHAMLQQAVRNGFPYVCEYRIAQTDGSYRWIFARGEPKYDAAESPVSMSGVAFDINERKEAEAEIMRSRSVEQSLRQEAEEANRSKDEFLAMLGHEMRNPLAPITTALQLMKLRSDDVFARERMTIERQVDHLTRLVDDLLDVSRITRGTVEISRERVNLANIAASAIEMASPLLEQRQHHLQVSVAAHGLIVDGDARRLAQIVSNLLTNAAKYTEPGGRIELVATRDGDEVVLRVRDNGIGIAPEILPRVFDLFVQEAQSIERARGGLGLGLAIVRTLVGLHDGTVLAQSEGRGRGSTFTIRLPAARPAPLHADELGVVAAEDEGERDPVGRRVLIVDDNIDAAELLAAALELLGHETRVAHDGPSALKLVESFHPEFAVLDIGLPVMDGYELAHRMRDLPALQGTRIVALTGYGQASDHRRSAEAGFDAHLVKPVQLSILEAMIAAE